MGGANFQGGVANLLFGQIFTENCMKLRKFGPGGGRTSLVPPLKSATLKYNAVANPGFLRQGTSLLFG